jgi:hypothetical protein
MWDMLVEPVVRVFGLVWHADERKGARWFAVGCLAIVLAGIGILAWIYAD